MKLPRTSFGRGGWAGFFDVGAEEDAEAAAALAGALRDRLDAAGLVDTGKQYYGITEGALYADARSMQAPRFAHGEAAACQSAHQGLRTEGAELQESTQAVQRFAGCAMPSLPSTDQATALSLQGTILYIEDEPVSFAVVEALLAEHPNVRLLRAQTGDEGVHRARIERPDAILLDMHLPDMSGIEVVRRLSEAIADGAFRVILLTADKLNIDVLKAMSLGAFEYLVKPVNAQALEASLGRALAVKGHKRL